MKVKRLLRRYRLTLFATVVVAYALAATTILLLLTTYPHAVLYLLDVLSPFTKVVRDVLWTFFPEAQWLRKAGEWMGSGARWMLGRTDARTESLGRLTLLDGPVLLTFLAWSISSILRLWVTYRVARRFDKHYRIVPHEQESAPKPEVPPKPQLPPAPQLTLPRRE